MKTLKSLLMLCAGLSFCACGSDNEPQFPEGEGAVEVKIVAPQTRAATEGDNEGTTVEVTGNIYVTVVHNGGAQWTQKVASGETSVKFYGVINPTMVKVSMNGGKDSYTFNELIASSTSATYTLKDAFGQDAGTATETFDLQAIKTIPVYGEAEPTLTGTIEQPADQPAGASKKYQMYTATVNLEIPVARLEVSIDRGNVASTQYQSLNAIGAYLDKLNSAGVTYTGGSYPNITPSTVNNYYYDSAYYGDAFTAQGTAVSPLKQALTSTPFVAGDAKTEVVGFNIYGTPAANVPHFKFIFTGAQAADGQTAVPSVMYAKIISYKEVGGTAPISLDNGEIYQIIGLDVVDSNINMMEDDGSLEFGLTATVVKANWTIKQITGNWANN